MSSDLLDAFGAGEQDAWSSPRHKNSHPQPRVDEEDEDDDFGDFEDAEKGGGDTAATSDSKDLLNFSEDPGAPFGPHLADSARWDQPEPVTHEAFEFQNANLSHQFSNPTESTRSDLRQREASITGQDDEFGDFVDQEVMFDATQFDQKPEPKPKPKPKQILPVEDFAFDADDNWNPVDVPVAPMVPTQPDPTSVRTNATREVMNTAPTVGKIKDFGPAPTNIPPPSVLLSVISNIYQYLSINIKEIVTMDRASSDPYEALDEPRISKLQQQLSIIRASARIIAGRKLRWKRDTMLSQSMKIGPAGQGGMKLSSVDKNETRREDQEIAEAVHIWKKQLGPLRSTIAKVNVHLSDEGLTIPDISDTIPIRQGKTSEGAVKAPKCCFLCGINRDERVAKVDLYVEDSFGEWWREYWGHRDCVTFWEESKGNLPQR